jgi:uncharacterized protein YjdB
MHFSGCAGAGAVDIIRRVRVIAKGWASLLLLVLVITPAAASAATLTSITVTPDGITLEKGFSQTYVATGHYSDGSTANVSQSADWSVSTIGVAVVQNTPGLKGLVTANQKGTTKITASITVGLTPIRGSATLTVIDGNLVSITTKPTTKSLEVGQTSQFKATALYIDSSTNDVTNSVTWTSTDPSVASVSNVSPTKGLVTANKVGTATIFARDDASGVTNTDGATTVRAQVSHLSFDPQDIVIGKGMKFPLRVYANRVDGSRSQITSEVEFSMVPTGVITIGTGTDAGIATAVSNGTVTISAFDAKRQLSTSTTGDDATLKVKGKLVELHVESNPIRMVVGDVKSARAIGLLSSGKETSDLRRLAQWSISDPTVATVGNTVNDVGEVTAKKAGVATLTASYNGFVSPETDNVQVLGNLQTLVLDVGDGLFPLNQKIQAKARATYEGGIELNVTDKCDWSVVNPTIAVVDNFTADVDGDGKGGVTGKKLGQTTVNVSCSGKKDSKQIQVIGNLDGLVVQPVSFETVALDQKQFHAMGQYDDGSQKDLTKVSTWSSSVPAVATVDNDANPGLVSTLGLGSSTITAKTGGFMASGTITVTAGLASVAVVPGNRTIPGSIGVKLRAKGTRTDNQVIDITSQVVWTSANPMIARVSNRDGEQGLTFGGRQEGTTQITATLPNTAFVAQATITTSCLMQSFQIDRPSEPAPVPVGQARYLRARGTFCNNTTDIITPDVVFTSSNPQVLVVSNDPKSYGLATGVSPGTVTVTAVDVSSGKSATNSLIVNVQ